MSTHAVSPQSSQARGGTRSIVISIDFGTTYSGIGWVETGNVHEHHIINEWPGRIGSNEKVPTTLLYNTKETKYKWGFEIDEEDSNQRRHEWFKLGLCPDLKSSALARNYPSTTALPQVHGQECERIITMYLALLREHVNGLIIGRYGSAGVNHMPREYIITVPAIWSDRAKNITLLCAEGAGMGHRNNIRIISEPEAAGIYALKNMSRLGLAVNDTFVICDAGGGTVDLISYTVTSLEPTPSIDEASSGSGGLCGSAFLDRIFDHWLREKFANYPAWNEEYHATAMEKWESNLKQNFMGDTSKDYMVPAQGLSTNSRLDIRNRKVIISGESICAIFEPVIREILDLIDDQISQVRARVGKVKAILLVGGFGSNEYLKRRIERQVGSAIGVIKVENCNTAVVRGALIKAAAERQSQLAVVRVASRVARRNYGTFTYEQFNPDIHDVDRKVPGTFEGYYRVKCYRWFIKKQASVLESEPQKAEYYIREQWSREPPKNIEIEVFTCESDDPPKHNNSGIVTELLRLKADLSQLPPQTFHVEVGSDGFRYYKLDFDIEVTLRSADLYFHLVHNGIKYDTISKEFV